MRLANRIIERARQPVTPVDRDLAIWASKLRGAECFEVDHGAGELSHATMATNPALASIRTRQNLSLPVQVCWFEWLGPSAGIGPFADEPPRHGTVVPRRCGVLVEADPSLRRGLLSWVWELPEQTIEPCPISIAFDWRMQPAAVPDIVRAGFEYHGQSWEQHLRKTHSSSRFASQDPEPFAAEEKRYGHVPCPLMPTFWAAADKVASQDERLIQKICHDILRDLEHEPIFLLGLIVCLSAPGLLDISDPTDMTRLNAARRKRGRTELLTFRRISASDRNVIKLSGRNRPIEAMRGFHAA